MKKLVFISALLFSVSGVAQENVENTETSEEARPGTQIKEHRGHRRKGNGKGKRMMEKIDVNKDGQIDLNEYLVNAEQRFQSMDMDKNGYVTGEEVRSFGSQLRKKHRDAMKKAREAYRESEQDAESE